MNNQKKSYVLALLAVLLWATSASAFKLTLTVLDSINLLFYSSFFSAIFFLAIIIFQGKLAAFKKNNLSDICLSMLTGFLNPFLYYIILYEAYRRLPGHIAQPLNFIWPLVIVILSVPLLKQKIRIKSIYAILISFIGIVIISTKANLLTLNVTDPKGIFLALISSIFWALFFIINMKDKRDEIVKLFLSFSFGFIYTLILVLYTNNLVFPNLIQFSGSIYIGLFEMGITFFIWLKALKLSQTTAKVSNFIYLTPFVSLFFLRFIVREEIHFSAIIGLIFIVSGIFLQSKTSVN